jgi:hypothetical protein
MKNLETIKISAGSHCCASEALKEKGFIQYKDDQNNPRFSKDGEVFKFNHPIWDIKKNKILLNKIN